MATITGRKVPATNTSDSNPNPSSSGTVKLKKQASKIIDRPESPIIGASQTSDTTSKVPGSPTSTSDETILCKHCKKQIPKDLHAQHSKPCLRQKQEQKRKKKEAQEKSSKDAETSDNVKGEADKTDATSSKPAPTTENPEEPDSTSKNSKKTASLAEGSTTNSTKKVNKKRKANDLDTASVNGDTITAGGPFKPPNKKQKKKDTAAAASTSADPTSTTAASSTPTTTTVPGLHTTTSNTTTAGGLTTSTTATAKPKPGGKPKGPVDVEKQCGVLLPNGAMCARSLTCKSHAMGAKRAVPGRSLPYDVLLQQYQKKNQAKLHKAALASGAPLPEDGLDGAQGPVDSDEERDAVMAGLARAAPRPLGERAVVSVRQRVQAVRMREMLSQALAGNRGGNLFAVGPRKGEMAPPSSGGLVNGEGGSGGGGGLEAWTAGQGSAGDAVRAASLVAT